MTITPSAYNLCSFVKQNEVLSEFYFRAQPHQMPHDPSDQVMRCCVLFSIILVNKYVTLRTGMFAQYLKCSCNNSTLNLINNHSMTARANRRYRVVNLEYKMKTMLEKKSSIKKYSIS